MLFLTDPKAVLGLKVFLSSLSSGIPFRLSSKVSLKLFTERSLTILCGRNSCDSLSIESRRHLRGPEASISFDWVLLSRSIVKTASDWGKRGSLRRGLIQEP